MQVPGGLASVIRRGEHRALDNERGTQKVIVKGILKGLAG